MRYLRLKVSLVIGLSALTVGCNSESQSSKNVVKLEPSATPPPPIARYDEEENGTYYYVGAVSEEDQKKGVAVGKALAYRYLGKNEKGEHGLLLVSDSGSPLLKSYCSDPCRVIKRGGERIGFSSDSIIGAAFEDAIAGNLKVYATPAAEKKAGPEIVSNVPKSFRGAWDEMVADGCKNREARFYIDATKFYNFEVEYDVTSVKIYSPNEIDITTTYKDENASQQSTVWELRLTDNGKSLTGRKSQETFYRRCPGT